MIERVEFVLLTTIAFALLGPLVGSGPFAPFGIFAAMIVYPVGAVPAAMTGFFVSLTCLVDTPHLNKKLGLRALFGAMWGLLSVVVWMIVILPSLTNVVDLYNWVFWYSIVAGPAAGACLAIVSPFYIKIPQ